MTDKEILDMFPEKIWDGNLRVNIKFVLIFTGNKNRAEEYMDAIKDKVKYVKDDNMIYCID